MASGCSDVRAFAVPAVEQAVMPFLGPERTLADVEKAREALEKAYQSAGFLSVFVDIPEQRIEGGVVRLRVVEGRIDRLAVTGSRYYDQGFIRQGVPALAPGTVPDFNQLQAQLGALNREAGKTVIMVTHDPKAAAHARRTIHLEKGELLPFDSATAS